MQLWRALFVPLLALFITAPAAAGPVKTRKLKRGDLVVLEAMGGGFTWGGAALRY